MPPEPAAKASREKRCPVCGKPAVAESRPFCSERCREVDLNRWLSGSYAIPGRPADDEED
ncbi:DNA gyrase inhibitor YacG [Rhodopseudomonas sp. B29]|uniref:DNA gyrase inhibitor YacG n=1 Tax=Rhodopseudomonas sp. B29 TaxID=95607 RepID=UPI00034AB52E|nr:DNA gyrase inhibitor YacG [Rhodopseudomonas sp. B29]